MSGRRRQAVSFHRPSEAHTLPTVHPSVKKKYFTTHHVRKRSMNKFNYYISSKSLSVIGLMLGLSQESYLTLTFKRGFGSNFAQIEKFALPHDHPQTD